MIRLSRYTRDVRYFCMEKINFLVVATISAILTIDATYYFQTDMIFAQTQTQPNLNAASVYDSGRMIQAV